MENSFYDFWRLYAPPPECRNRYRACEKVWNGMDEPRRHRIIYQLQREQMPDGEGKVHTANPYFYLIRADPQPYDLPERVFPASWLSRSRQMIPSCSCPTPDHHGTICGGKAKNHLMTKW